MNRRGALSIVCLCAILVAAGCGGGGDETGGGASDASTTTSALAQVKTSDLSKAEFIRKGDAICAAREKEFQEQRQAFVGLISDHRMSLPQERQLVTDYLLPSFQAQAGGISELGAPTGDSEEVGAFLAEFEKAIVEGGGDPEAMLGSASAPLSNAADMAREYGFETCLSQY